MRPTVRGKAKPAAPRKAPKSPKVDHARMILKMDKAIRSTLVEVRKARQYLAKSYAGPEHECLYWAESILCNGIGETFTDSSHKNSERGEP